jgi:hypothetical protein
MGAGCADWMRGAAVAAVDSIAGGAPRADARRGAAAPCTRRRCRRRRARARRWELATPAVTRLQSAPPRSAPARSALPYQDLREHARATAAGISAVDLSVEISNIGSSRLT